MREYITPCGRTPAVCKLLFKLHLADNVYIIPNESQQDAAHMWPHPKYS